MNKITVMWENTPQLEINIDENFNVTSKKLVDDVIPAVPDYIMPNNITLKRMNQFIESRAPERTRPDMPLLLKKYDIPSYNPYWFCKKSHGRSMTDFLWVKFDNEEIDFNDIRLR